MGKMQIGKACFNPRQSVFAKQQEIRPHILQIDTAVSMVVNYVWINIIKYNYIVFLDGLRIMSLNVQTTLTDASINTL